VDDSSQREYVTIDVPLELLTEAPAVSESGWSPELTKLKRALEERFNPKLAVNTLGDEGGVLEVQLENSSQRSHSIRDDDVEWAIGVIVETFHRNLDQVSVTCKRRLNLRLPYALRDNPGEALGEGATATVLGRAY
jgi:hypothetical protein